MKKQDWEEEVLKRQPCAHIGTIIKIVCDKHKLSRTEFFVLLELHKKEEFTWNDFATAELTANWDKHRWYRLKNDDWVKLFRAKDGKFKMYNLYKVTTKTKRAVRDFYDYSSGAKLLPESSYSKNATYTSNRIVNKVKEINQDNQGD